MSRQGLKKQSFKSHTLTGDKDGDWSEAVKQWAAWDNERPTGGKAFERRNSDRARCPAGGWDMGEWQRREDVIM